MGIVTERDLVNKGIARKMDPKNVSLGEIVSSPLVAVYPYEDLLKAWEIMQKHNKQRLTVVRDDII